LWLARCSEHGETARKLPDYGLEADRYSGSAPVAVVEATDLKLGHDLPLARWLDFTRPGSVAVQGLVGPGVVVVREVLTENPPQVSFAQHEDVVEALPPDRSDQAFDERIRVRRRLRSIRPMRRDVSGSLIRSTHKRDASLA
jgi:hypothetical protein